MHASAIEVARFFLSDMAHRHRGFGDIFAAGTADTDRRKKGLPP